MDGEVWGKRKPSRREFLKAGGAAFLVTASVTGCDFLSTNPAEQGKQQGPGTVGAGGKGKEAPILADLVKQGKLPAVEERLPKEPVVVEPLVRTGNYGGEWNTALLGVSDTPWLGRTTGYECLVRWDPDWTGIIPNVAKEFEVNKDGTEFTFKLREGMNWSDGEPFTADDLVFAYEDVFLDEELYPATLTYYLSGEEPSSLEKLDEYTIRFVFAEPSGLFLQNQAAPYGIGLVSHPRHYLRQFHNKYNPDVERLVEEEGVADWVELFLSKVDPWLNADLPRIHGWVPTTSLGEGNRMVFERNPYYWKTDPEGSQLPYIDRVIFDLIEDVEVMLTKALNGEIDMHVRHFNNPRNKPVLAENRQRGNYRFFSTSPAYENTTVIALNLTHKDPTKREIFNNKDFRTGLSHAINRQEIIDVVFQQQGEPYQAAPRPGSPFYDEGLARQYTKYDVDLANEFLDQAGYSERDSEGTRLGPNGEPITFTVEFATGYFPEWADTLEFVQGYWQTVGIDANIKPIDRSLFYERKAANEHDANVWTGATGLDVDLKLEPRWYLPFTEESNFAIPWAQWYISNGADGMEPPEIVRRQMELYERLKLTVDEEGQATLMRRILDIAKEQFYVMGVSLYPEGYGIVKNNFHNVPDSMPESHLYNQPAPTNPEQYFVER